MWYTPVITATQEAKVGGLRFDASLELETFSKLSGS
jgi:hypothetical protein